MTVSERRLCVIGAGVSGLTSAILLAEAGYDVTIIAEGSRDATTSSAAAAFWYPFWTGDKPEHDWYLPEWATHSYFTFEKLAKDAQSGVTEVTLHEYFDSDQTYREIHRTVDSMWWRFLPQLNFSELRSADLISLSCLPPTSDKVITFSAGISFRTFVVNMTDYLPFLERMATSPTLKCRLLSNVRISKERTLGATSISQLLAEYHCVVNCSGLGSRDLVGDTRLVPKEGIVVTLEARHDVEVNRITLMHTGTIFGGGSPFYIVPRGGPSPDVLLGGTIDVRDGHPGQTVHYSWPATSIAVQQVAENILETCCSCYSDLAKLSKKGVSVGYRPAREIPKEERAGLTPPYGVRLEPETTAGSERIIHNYGHGGGGITFSWGCAKRVVELVDRLAV